MRESDEEKENGKRGIGEKGREGKGEMGEKRKEVKK